MAARRPWGEGSLRPTLHRGKLKYRARLWVTDRGIRRRLEKLCLTAEEARETIRVWKNDEKDKTLPSQQRENLGAFLLNWIEEIHRPRVEPPTYLRYESLIRKHLVPATKRVRLSDIDGDPSAILEIYDAIGKAKHPTKATKTQPSRMAQTSQDTVKKCHAVLAVALGDAVILKKIRMNGAAMVPKRMKPKSKPKKKVPYTIEEMRAFLKAANGHELENFFIVALTTQMRQGELFALSPSDLDLESAKAIFVHRTLQDDVGNTRRISDDTKTASGQRRVDLPTIAVAALKAQLAKKKSEVLVFPNERGKPMSRNNLLRRDLYPLMQAAGLRKIDFHTFRHSGNSALSESVPLIVLQKRMGHASEATTRIYSHRTPGMGEIAVRALELLFPYEEIGVQTVVQEAEAS